MQANTTQLNTAINMPIYVKYFASLRELTGKNEEQLAPEKANTIHEVWLQTMPSTAMPNNTLVALNMEYSDLTQPVQDGDEVAFFPPVTGG